MSFDRSNTSGLAAHCRRAVVAFALLAGLALWTGGAAVVRAADRIEDEMPVQSLKVMKFLKGKGYKNVGVLKFRVKKGNEPPTFHAGPLNVAMANRLENMLLIRNDKTKPIGILHEASKVAADHKEHASYLTAAGCTKLFKYKYPLAWGSRKVEADAFLTGLVQISPDLRTTTIRIEVLERASPKLRQVTSFDVRTDRTILTDVCQCFVLNSRRLRSMGADAQEEEAVKDADARSRGKTATSNEYRLIDLEILYDKTPVEIKQDGGQEYVAQEPGEGQEVVFRIKNKGDKRVGVVLAVNGRNTLYDEDLQAAKYENCTRWILDPGASYDIQGVYKEDNSYLPFKVLSEEDSLKEEEQDPNPHLGQIHVVVFAEGGAASAAMFKGQGLRRKVPIAQARPKTAAEAALLARNTAGARPRAMGFIKAGDNLKRANLQDSRLENPTQQETHVIIYRARKQ